MTTELLVHVQAGGMPSDIARNLRALAEQIESGAKGVFQNCCMRAVVRDYAGDSECGEMPIRGRYYAVDSEDETVERPIALFPDESIARHYGAARGLVVTRVDLFGSCWNSTEPDSNPDPSKVVPGSLFVTAGK